MHINNKEKKKVIEKIISLENIAREKNYKSIESIEDEIEKLLLGLSMEDILEIDNYIMKNRLIK
jgi:hypothetical protein